MSNVEYYVGGYVSFKDYKALKARLDAAEEGLKALADYIGFHEEEKCPIERAAWRALAILKGSVFEEDRKAMNLIHSAAKLIEQEQGSES